MRSYRSAHFLEQHKMQHYNDWGVLVADRGPGCVPAATVAAAAGYYDQPLEAKSCFLDHKMNGRLHDASAAVKIEIMILPEIDMMLHDARFLRLFSVR